jgi:hypothetical protein
MFLVASVRRLGEGVPDRIDVRVLGEKTCHLSGF